MPKKLLLASHPLNLDQVQGVGRIIHPQQCLLVKSLLLAGLHQASEPGTLLHSTSLQHNQHRRPRCVKSMSADTRDSSDSYAERES